MQQPYDANLSRTLDSPEFRALFKTNPLRHLGALLFDWAIILATIFVTVSYPSPALYFLAVIIIGARMHALAILVHDATHFRFLKNRKWNDRLTNLLAMYPIFSSLDKYRDNHLRHHRHLNTMDDPDWVAKLTKRAFQFPKTKTEFLLTVGSYLLFYQGMLDAYWFLKRFKVTGKAKTTSDAGEGKWLRPGFYLTLFSLLTVFGGWTYFLLFWVVPYFTTFFLFQYIRSVAEHFGELAYEDDLNSTRTVVSGSVERFFVAPHNVGYHLEHHLFPAVPFYHLPELHRQLMELPEFNTRAHITRGYLRGLLGELGQVRAMA